MGNGLASVLNSQIPGMSATAQVTGGSIDNLNLIGTGKSYIGFSMADAAKDAQIGEGRFSGNRIDLKTLLVMHPNIMHVVTVESTGIRNIGDLRGRRVSTGALGSATEVMALRLLESAGIDPQRGLMRERFSVADSVNAIKDRRVDAFFWLGGLPTAAITDLANTPGARMIMLDSTAEISAMNKKYGNLYYPTIIPRATYSGMNKDNNVAAVANILAVNANMPNDQAYKIVKAIFENQPALTRMHQEFINLNIKNQTENSTPIDFHPGVIRYLNERNIGVYKNPTISNNGLSPSIPNQTSSVESAENNQQKTPPSKSPQVIGLAQKCLRMGLTPGSDDYSLCMKTR